MTMLVENVFKCLIYIYIYSKRGDMPFAGRLNHCPYPSHVNKPSLQHYSQHGWACKVKEKQETETLKAPRRSVRRGHLTI